MKTKILTTIALLFMVILANATCTVTTDCGTFEFPEATSISTSQTSINGVTTLIIKDQNGVVLKTLTNCGSRISVSCQNNGNGNGNGNGNDFNICDIIPARLKPFFGCN